MALQQFRSESRGLVKNRAEMQLQDVDELKQRLTDVWDGLEQISLHVWVFGVHFEHNNTLLLNCLQ